MTTPSPSACQPPPAATVEVELGEVPSEANTQSERCFLNSPFINFYSPCDQSPQSEDATRHRLWELDGDDLPLSLRLLRCGLSASRRDEERRAVDSRRRR
ncbi:hypothetical protein Cni_G02442 [Canna indica]|uniref:Uncharacterized protein n=1 Tax=Canna indica TaxID=4628 RepID=A0AAQ3Q2R2_9LILI|nr:hypothetical protein Cni_G02442 [Canna indica]